MVNADDFLIFAGNYPKRFPIDILLASYVGRRIAEEKKINRYSVTKFTKIVANFVQDLKTGEFTHYLPLLTVEPNKYGMIAVFPKNSGFEIKVPIYNLSTMTHKVNLWEKVDEWDPIEKRTKKWIVWGSRTSANIKNAFSENAEELGQIFDRSQWKRITDLSIIYSKLNTTQLNILASHRNIGKSKECLKFEFESWERKYQNLIELFSVKPSTDLSSQIEKELHEMVTFCEQIEIKTDYVFHKIDCVIDELNKNKHINEEVVLDLIDSIRKRTVLNQGDIIELQRDYIFSKEYLLPVIASLVDLSINFYNSNLSITKEKIDNMMKKSIFEDITLNSKKIIIKNNSHESLSIIKKFHDDKISEQGKDLLKIKDKKISKEDDISSTWVDCGDERYEDYEGTS